MATLLKVFNNLADIKSAGGVALRVRTQGGSPAQAFHEGGSNWPKKAEDWRAEASRCARSLVADFPDGQAPARYHKANVYGQKSHDRTRGMMSKRYRTDGKKR
jgi:hypothetical protein